MLRISRLLKQAYDSNIIGHEPQSRQYVVIWNLTNLCNLSCFHCYANANSKFGNEELNTKEALKVIDDLLDLQVLVLIMSGGEPLLRSDFFDLATYAREKGIFCALSSNGTFINEVQVKRILDSRIDYVGISIDGKPEIHDEFRGRRGAYEASLRAIRLCKDAGIKVGLRFSLTSHTWTQVPCIFDLFEREGLSKLYISHMNYSHDAMSHLALQPRETRKVMRFIVSKSLEYLRDGSTSREIVTGNNSADAPFLLLTIGQENPALAKNIFDIFQDPASNGDRSRLINIDPGGETHPDPYCKFISFGNVRESSVVQILHSTRDSPFVTHKNLKRPFKGRCGACRFFSLCGGNSRARSYAQSYNWWGSDPSCYLTDEEISLNGNGPEGQII
jgi:radical SAM protein with 4Fe4S-binding SPASM domain